ncbi:MAG: iron-sulfur cluster assembly accessory protein [Kiritimatiellae bacterium]|nr:iron-sulfur cluster assembly accessory protein [Kiritimatiellia bacterium]
MAIHISDKAKQELAKLEVAQPNFLRISVTSGGCSGMTYTACIDNSRADSDQVLFEESDLCIVADPGSAMFLDGLEIDYSDDLISAGFRFKNPKATKACGCGSSFAV